jgi:hypothetical protein
MDTKNTEKRTRNFCQTLYFFNNRQGHIVSA